MSFATRVIVLLICYAICIGGLVAVATEHSESPPMQHKSIPVRFDHKTHRVWLRV